MIGPALVAAAVAGAGAATYAGWRAGSERLAHDAARRLAASPQAASDLAALGTDARAFVGGAGGRLAAGAGIGAVLAVAGWGLVGPLAILAVFAGLAGAGVLVWSSLGRQAAKARSELRVAGLEMAELVSLAIGGGLGVPAALERAASSLVGPAGGRLAHVARSGPEPWAGLEAMGEEVRVAELADLGRTLALGAAHQARTREVLLGWAQAARAARLEEAEAAAAATTEAMTGPLALVAFGFLLVVGVPAVLQLLSGVSAVHV